MAKKLLQAHELASADRFINSATAAKCPDIVASAVRASISFVRQGYRRSSSTPNPASTVPFGAAHTEAARMPTNPISVTPPAAFRRSDSLTCLSANALARTAYRSRSYPSVRHDLMSLIA